MYSREQRIKAVEPYVKYGLRSSKVISELGCPNRLTPRLWHKDCLSAIHEGRECLPPEKSSRKSKFSDGRKRAAVEHCLGRGKTISCTIECLGCPSRQALANWIDEPAPNEREPRLKATPPQPGQLAEADKIEAARDLRTRSTSAKEVADKHGAGRCAPYFWKYSFLGKEGGCSLGDCASDLPEDIEELQKLHLEPQRDAARLRLGKDIPEGAAGLMKKDPGVDPKNLSDKEKARLIDALMCLVQ